GLPALSPYQPVRHAIDQRLPGRLDEVVADADGLPGVLAVGQLDQDSDHRVGAVSGLQDADAVVDQVELLDDGVGLYDRAPQGTVERVDRAVALRGDDHALVTGTQLDGGLGHGFLAGAGVGDHPP